MSIMSNHFSQKLTSLYLFMKKKIFFFCLFFSKGRPKRRPLIQGKLVVTDSSSDFSALRSPQKEDVGSGGYRRNK